MKAKNIIVKDYLYKGNYIFGTFYGEFEIKGNIVAEYILDDGDVYSEKGLQEAGYKYIFVSSEDIINLFKRKFK